MTRVASVHSYFFDRRESLKTIPKLLPDGSKLVWLKQVHSAHVLEVKNAVSFGHSEADAMVTLLPNVALVIHTADCIPLLSFEDEVIGACHGGWRGISKGIISNWVHKMVSLGAHKERLKVLIGPAIGPCHFEVGFEVAEELCKIDGKKLNGNQLQKIVHPHGDVNKKYIDLPALAVEHLLLNGILANNIDVSKSCTYCAPEKYFSYRRNKTEMGRLEAVILRSK